MKKLISIALCFFGIISMVACSKEMDMHTVLQEQNFTGVVLEVHDETILAKVNAEEDVYKSSDLVSVSLDVQIPDGLSEYSVGDEVRVYYNGEIAESYPAQVTTVYAITIVEEANQNSV